MRFPRLEVTLPSEQISRLLASGADTIFDKISEPHDT
jgi:hypothetical protein